MIKTAKIYMAPMAGVTDRAFREIAFEYGADYTTTEMISAKGLYYQAENTQGLLSRTTGEKTGIQIFGSDPDIIGEVIEKYINHMDFEFLDFNMGCPAPKIFNNGEGAYLMQEEDLAYEILRTMVKKSTKPVYLKMRLGVDKKNINFLDIGKLAEKAGADKVCLHARTRKQFYSGKVDIDAIRALKEKLSIPVIGNGDIVDANSAKYMLEYTGCDAIMVGRGALGNPFIFEKIKAGLMEENYEKPTVEELYQVIKKHYHKVVEYKGQRALVEMRKHISWYLKGYPDSSKVKDLINKTESLEEIKKIITEYLSQFI